MDMILSDLKEHENLQNQVGEEEFVFDQTDRTILSQAALQQNPETENEEITFDAANYIQINARMAKMGEECIMEEEDEIETFLRESNALTVREGHMNEISEAMVVQDNKLLEQTAFQNILSIETEIEKQLPGFKIEIPQFNTASMMEQQKTQGVNEKLSYQPLNEFNDFSFSKLSRDMTTENAVLYEIENKTEHMAPLTVEEMWQASESKDCNDDVTTAEELQYLNNIEMEQVAANVSSLPFFKNNKNSKDQFYVQQLPFNEDGVLVGSTNDLSTAQHVVVMGENGKIISQNSIVQPKVPRNPLASTQKATTPIANNDFISTSNMLPISSLFIAGDNQELSQLQGTQVLTESDINHVKQFGTLKNDCGETLVDEDTDVILMKPLNTRKQTPSRCGKPIVSNDYQRQSYRQSQNSIDLTEYFMQNPIKIIESTRQPIKSFRKKKPPRTSKFHEISFNAHNAKEKPPKSTFGNECNNMDDTIFDLDKIFGRATKKPANGQVTASPRTQTTPAPIKSTKQTTLTTVANEVVKPKTNDKNIAIDATKKLEQQIEYKSEMEFKENATSFQTKFGTLPKNIQSNMTSSESDEDETETAKCSLKCGKCKKLFKSKKTLAQHSILCHAGMSNGTEGTRAIPKKSKKNGIVTDSEDEVLDFIGGSSSEDEFVKKIKFSGPAPQTRSRTRQMQAMQKKQTKKNSGKKDPYHKSNT